MSEIMLNERVKLFKILNRYRLLIQNYSLRSDIEFWNNCPFCRKEEPCWIDPSLCKCSSKSPNIELYNYCRYRRYHLPRDIPRSLHLQILRRMAECYEEIYFRLQRHYQAEEKYRFSEEYPYGKYKLVQFSFYVEYFKNEHLFDQITSYYFDYFEKEGECVYLHSSYDPYFDIIVLCEDFMQEFGDYSQLFLWNPETRCHDILVARWG